MSPHSFQVLKFLHEPSTKHSLKATKPAKYLLQLLETKQIVWNSILYSCEPPYHQRQQKTPKMKNRWLPTWSLIHNY